MVILWGKVTLTVNYNFAGLGYVGINVICIGGVYNFVNIYASCRGTNRRLIWISLVDRKNRSVNEEWCLRGDFNVVSNREEIMEAGSHHNSRDIKEFRTFIENMDLVDIPCVGGRFTCFKDNGKAMSRPDRLLLYSKLIED